MIGELPGNSAGLDRRPTCPNHGEQYRMSDSMGQTGDVTERHPVATSHNIRLRDETPVLVLTAECRCGWSSSNVVGGSDE